MAGVRPDIFDRIMDTRLLSPLRPLYARYREQLLYLLFGFLTTVVNLAVFWACSQVVEPLLANVVAWVAGVAFAYVTNRTWVFESESEDVLRELASFTGARLATLVLEEALLWVGIGLLGLPTMPVKLVAQVLVIVGNYLFSKFVVFR